MFVYLRLQRVDGDEITIKIIIKKKGKKNVIKLHNLGEKYWSGIGVRLLF